MQNESVATPSQLNLDDIDRIRNPQIWGSPMQFDIPTPEGDWQRVYTIDNANYNLRHLQKNATFVELDSQTMRFSYSDSNNNSEIPPRTEKDEIIRKWGKEECSRRRCGLSGVLEKPVLISMPFKYTFEEVTQNPGKGSVSLFEHLHRYPPSCKIQDAEIENWCLENAGIPLQDIIINAEGEIRVLPNFIEEQSTQDSESSTTRNNVDELIKFFRGMIKEGSIIRGKEGNFKVNLDSILLTYLLI